MIESFRRFPVGWQRFPAPGEATGKREPRVEIGFLHDSLCHGGGLLLDEVTVEEEQVD